MTQNKRVIECVPEHVINQEITLANIERKTGYFIWVITAIGYALLGLGLWVFGYGNGPFGDETVYARFGAVVLYLLPFVMCAYYTIKLSGEEQRRIALLNPLKVTGYQHAAKFKDNEPTSLDDCDFSKWKWLGEGEAELYVKRCAIKKLSNGSNVVTLPKRILTGV